MPTLWTVDELTHHVFPSTFLVEPILPRGGLAMMYGKREIGKSHLALTLAACITEGGVLFGRYRTRKGPVVYVQADMSPPIQQARLRAAQRRYPLSELYFAFPDFLSVPSMKADDELVLRVRELEPELIIWDTLRQIHRMDMNSDETPAWVYGTARHLFPGTTHLFIHHDKKTVVDQEKLDSDESFRGSGAWLDNADTGIKLKAVGQDKLFVEFSKTRTCPHQAPVTLSLASETMLLYAMGESTTELIERWRSQHPDSPPEQLERFLLASFAAPPRTVAALVELHSRKVGQFDERIKLGPEVGTVPISELVTGDGNGHGSVHGTAGTEGRPAMDTRAPLPQTSSGYPLSTPGRHRVRPGVRDAAGSGDGAGHKVGQARRFTLREMTHGRPEDSSGNRAAGRLLSPGEHPGPPGGAAGRD